jgi:hypothetical protein
VAVDHEVEQPPQQEPDAVVGQVGRAVPALHHPLDVEPRVLADGDQRPRGDERSQLTGDQLAGVMSQADGVGGEEVVVLVAVQLGPLMLLDGVLDGQRVQPELLGDDLQVLLVGLAQVQPHHRVRLLEEGGDLGGREVLGLQHPLAVQPRMAHAVSLAAWANPRHSTTAQDSHRRTRAPPLKAAVPSSGPQEQPQTRRPSLRCRQRKHLPSTDRALLWMPP